MIGYTTIGTSDLGRAARFYDAILEPLGATRLHTTPREAYWGQDAAGVKFAVVLPHDGEAPCVGNGSMVALKAAGTGTVDRVHALALEHGGADEGGPGPRGEGSFYGAYFRDLDGHKICVFVV